MTGGHADLTYRKVAGTRHPRCGTGTGVLCLGSPRLGALQEAPRAVTYRPIRASYR
jgi:hypothetical protein